VTATGWNLQSTIPISIKVRESEIGVNSNIFFNPSNFASDGQRTLVDCNAEDENQAELVAQKELDKNLMQQVTLWGVAEGNPFLTPGIAVQVLGVTSALEGRYVLTEVTHSIDSIKGFISEINSAPSAIEKTKQIKNATIGVVSQVNDPNNLGRVKVLLPTYNNIETDWLQVLTPGAGSKKGQLMLPDVGDNVLLLIVNGEPAQSIVLGGLYGEKDLPHSVVEEGAVKRFVTQTAGKQRILLDDTEVSIRIETQSGHYISMTPEKIGITRKNGSFVTLTDDRMTIHSETNLEIEAPGSSITFRGKKIDFEEA
jgi:phage baseplate assembly protein V